MNRTVCVPSGCPPVVSMAPILSGKSCGLTSPLAFVFSLMASATSFKKSVRLLFLAIIYTSVFMADTTAVFIIACTSDSVKIVGLPDRSSYLPLVATFARSVVFA